MEEIPYRRSKVIVQTIPKGTLLFRTSKSPQEDMRGIELPDGTRCIHRNHNVFFYPNPFAAEAALGRYLPEQYKMHVFRLNHDVKVVRLLLPSRYHRSTKNTRRNFIKSCDKVKKGCLPRKMREYNPCFSDGFMTAHPSIVGMMAVAKRDGYAIQRALRRETMKKNAKYFHLAEDSIGSESVPELILHPLRERPTGDVIVHPEDTLDTNYSFLKTFRGSQTGELQSFMDKHAVYDSDTYYYRYA